jgi:hypothetical protein
MKMIRKREKLRLRVAGITLLVLASLLLADIFLAGGLLDGGRSFGNLLFDVHMLVQLSVPVTAAIGVSLLLASRTRRTHWNTLAFILGVGLCLQAIFPFIWIGQVCREIDDNSSLVQGLLLAALFGFFATTPVGIGCIVASIIGRTAASRSANAKAEYCS